LTLAGMELSRLPADALYIIAGAALLLLFIGIHNAWDTVTYMTIERSRAKEAGATATSPAMPSPSEESAMATAPSARAGGEPAARADALAESVPVVARSMRSDSTPAATRALESPQASRARNPKPKPSRPSRARKGATP